VTETLTATMMATDTAEPDRVGSGVGRDRPTVADADRAPVCPVCHKRLVILASRSGRDAAGAYVRRQLWGCPRGHATASYASGAFGPMELLPTLDQPDD